jgi:hypothetical protein
MRLGSTLVARPLGGRAFLGCTPVEIMSLVRFQHATRSKRVRCRHR